MNPISGLLRSRKFLLAVIDAIAGILGLWVGTLATQETATLIMATWGALQPVFIAVIAMIAYEDKAKLEAKSRTDAALSSSRSLSIPLSSCHDITALIGMVFAKRGFRDMPIGAAMDYFEDAFGYTDLTDEQEAAFCAAFANPSLRAAVDNVWDVYDQQRTAGAISAASPWYD